jgi:hypothetical protein
MSDSEEVALVEETIGEVPKRGSKRYVLLAIVILVAVVLGFRRFKTKPVASDAAPPEAET